MTKLILHNAPIEYDFITGLSRLRTPFGTTATLSRISRFDGFNHNDCDLRAKIQDDRVCLLYTSPSPRDRTRSRMPSSA